MDPSQPWLLLTKWGKQYGMYIGGIPRVLLGINVILGPLTYFDTRQRLLVINSLDVARELLDKRSSKYSDRPEAPSTDL